jgi:polyisoprenoid-binding protein YceI
MRRIAGLAFAVVVVSTYAHGAEYVVKAGEPNQVVFTSKATAETFQGKTKQLSGRIVVDPAAVGDSILVRLEVDLASLDTGIGKRNKDMCKGYLETEKYPKAVFEGASVLNPKGAALEAGKTIAFDCEGDFTLHGVTKRMRVTVDVTPRDARTLAFKTSFRVPLADYKISRPKFLFLKLGEVQEVAVEGVATSAN